MKSVITWEIERNIQFTHLQRKRYDTSCLLWLHYYSHYVFVPNKCTEEQTSDFAARIVFGFQFGMMVYVSYSFCHWHYQTKPTRATSISIPTVETSCLYPIPVMFGRYVLWARVCLQRTSFIYSTHCLANINIPCHMWYHVIAYLPLWYTRLLPSYCSYSITAKMEKVKQQIPFKKQQIYTFSFSTFAFTIQFNSIPHPIQLHNNILTPNLRKTDSLWNWMCNCNQFYITFLLFSLLFDIFQFNF